MMRGLCGIALLSLGGWLTGCAFDLAVTSGAAIPRGDAAPSVAWSGEVRASAVGAGTVDTCIWPIDHLTLGFELQGHALRDRGNYFSAGGSLGLVEGDTRHTALALFDAGAPLGWGAPVRGYYVGSTLSYLWSLDQRSEITATNRNLRALYARPQLGPMLRYRRQSLDRVAADAEPTSVVHELLVGLQLRVLLTSDLL